MRRKQWRKQVSYLLGMGNSGLPFGVIFSLLLGLIVILLELGHIIRTEDIEDNTIGATIYDCT